MARLFQPTITRYVDSDGRRCLKDAPGARKVSEKSRTWRGEYRDYSGILRTVKLNANKQASRQMLAELERKAAQQRLLGEALKSRTDARTGALGMHPKHHGY